MAWTIHSWSVDRGVGAIASPHFGPVPFDAAANVDDVPDFLVGEPVLVELEGTAPNFLVRLVRPTSQRQPKGTHWPQFDAVNGRFGDAWIEKQSAESVQFWLGDCCEYCTPNAVRVRFDGVTATVGLDGDLDFSGPLFRLASPDEMHAQSLHVDSGYHAFCVVTSHGHGLDGPLLFIVSRAAAVFRPQES
jgi:hypothetical protein